MNCIEFEKRLNEQFGPSRLEEAAELVEHAERCASCRQALEQFRLVSDALELWREQVPDVDLTDAVVVGHRAQPEVQATLAGDGPIFVSRHAGAELSQPSHPAALAGIVSRPFLPGSRIKGPRQVWLAAASFAAIVVAAIFIFGLRDGGRQPLPQPHVARDADHSRDVKMAENPGPREPESPLADVPDPLPVPQQAAYYDLAQKAAGALDEVSAFVMTGSTPPMSPSESGAEESEGWIDGLQHQLQPIGRSLDDAFDFLWQAGQSADNSQS